MEEAWKEIHLSSSANPNTTFNHFLFSTQPFRNNNNNILHSSSANHNNNSNSKSSASLSFGNKRLFPDSDRDADSSDTRSKRMIKNRESAARSRARKQAYTDELELKLELLKKENARLTKQLQQMEEGDGVLDNQVKMKNPSPLYRTTTAPF